MRWVPPHTCVHSFWCKCANERRKDNAYIRTAEETADSYARWRSTRFAILLLSLRFCFSFRSLFLSFIIPHYATKHVNVNKWNCLVLKKSKIFYIELWCQPWFRFIHEYWIYFSVNLPTNLVAPLICIPIINIGIRGWWSLGQFTAIFFFAFQCNSDDGKRNNWMNEKNRDVIGWIRTEKFMIYNTCKCFSKWNKTINKQQLKIETEHNYKIV